jgi:isopenicillin-N N-acyltransferase-like protein
MRQLVLEGTPRAIGIAHGKALRDEIHALAEERLRLSLAAAAEAGAVTTRDAALALSRRFLPIQERWSPAVHAEFSGIAEGAGIAPELLLIGNGYTDYKDVLCRQPALVNAAQECTVFRAAPEATRDGRVYVGQTWDMHSSAEPFIFCLLRRPVDGPATLGITTAGCLSLVGLNEAGIACGNSNLVPTDARPGVIYLALIHAALAERSWEAACAVIRDAPRSSGHNYYLAGPGGAYVDIETTAEAVETLLPTSPTYVHANHYQSSRLSPLQAPLRPDATTAHRERRLAARLAERAGTLDPEALRLCLADHEPGHGPVCVHDRGESLGSKSCAAVILCPEVGALFARVGNPCEGPLERFTLA